MTWAARVAAAQREKKRADNEQLSYGASVGEGFPEAIQNVGHVMTLAGARLRYGSRSGTASLHRHNTSSAVRFVARSELRGDQWFVVRAGVHPRLAL